MPWTTPTLKQVRMMVRDDVTAAFSGAVRIGNNVLRVMSDAMAGLGHLTLRYLDWLSRQFLPDTAEGAWLDRHGDIWLVNSDNSVGRKGATLATGSITMTGVASTPVPIFTQLESTTFGTGYETTQAIVLGSGATPVTVRALDPGLIGNLEAGETISLLSPIAGVDDDATVVLIDGGLDPENDDDLRARILFRIRQPPAGGDANDYVAWATAVPGVTRAWASTEMGIGTVTVRFMMDELRAGTGGFPNAGDITTVTDYIDQMRPVAIKDRWVLAPVPEPINFTIADLNDDTPSIRASIEIAVKEALRDKAAPAHIINGVQQSAETIYAAWISDAIIGVVGVKNFTLIMDDHPMPNNGSLGVLGTIIYDHG